MPLTRQRTTHAQRTGSVVASQGAAHDCAKVVVLATKTVQPFDLLGGAERRVAALRERQEMRLMSAAVAGRFAARLPTQTAALRSGMNIRLRPYCTWKRADAFASARTFIGCCLTGVSVGETG